MGTVRLRPGHVRPIWAGHPWVFAQAVAGVDGAPGAGDPVSVVDPKGRFLGRGYFAPDSAIPVRLLTDDPDEELEEAFIARRLEEAKRFRGRVLGLPGAQATGYRLVNGAGDRLSGLVVDILGDVAMVQLLTPGMRLRADVVAGQIMRVADVRAVLKAPGGARSDDPDTEEIILRGETPKHLSFRENEIDFEIPLEVGQKTGFYFDQREHRARVQQLAEGRKVLDAYAFVGAFGLAAARGGAKEVVCLESSPLAVSAGAHIAHRNGLASRIRYEKGDVKRILPEWASSGERFDLIVVDPPKLVPTVRHLTRGQRAYRKLNANALRLASAGAILVSCSCSAALSTEDFLRILSMAARDAQRHVHLFHMGHQGGDHPVPPGFPQGRYLKAAFLHVLA